MSPAIRIVLVDTSHPGNIGASARAMKNMGLESLVLVRPGSHPDPEAEARASGAADVLARARVVTSVDAAIGGCGLVLGTTARARSASTSTPGRHSASQRAFLMKMGYRSGG